MSQRYTFFMLLQSAPDWLKLGRADRQRFLAEQVRPVFARYPAVTMRFYDAEAFSAAAPTSPYSRRRTSGPTVS